MAIEARQPFPLTARIKPIENPKVSVIVPAYKVERYLGECIASIQSQTHPNLEIIIVDDGSPDGSGAIADRYADRDTRIKVIHTTNRGVSEARNAGLAAHTGHYVTFVDGDDTVAEGFVDYLLDVARRTGASFCISTEISCEERPTPEEAPVDVYSSDEAISILLDGLPIGCWNKLYESNFLREHSLTFDSKYFMGEGLKFITCAAQAAGRVGVGHRGLYRYRLTNAESATTKYGIEKCLNALAALEDIYSSLSPSPTVARAMRAQLWHTYFYTLESLTALGTKEEHRSLYAASVRYLRHNAPLAWRSASRTVQLKALISLVDPAFAARLSVARKRRRMEQQRSTTDDS